MTANKASVTPKGDGRFGVQTQMVSFSVTVSVFFVNLGGKRAAYYNLPSLDLSRRRPGKLAKAPFDFRAFWRSPWHLRRRRLATKIGERSTVEVQAVQTESATAFRA